MKLLEPTLAHGAWTFLSAACRITSTRAAFGHRERATVVQGFSLLEVLVAMFVLVVALVGLTQGVTLALQSGKESEQQTTAALFAAGVIETLRAEGDLQDGEKEADCGDALAMYRYRQTLKSGGIDGLHEVTVVVENTRSGKAIYELRTLLFEAPDDTRLNSSASRTGTAARSRRQR